MRLSQEFLLRLYGHGGLQKKKMPPRTDSVGFSVNLLPIMLPVAVRTAGQVSLAGAIGLHHEYVIGEVAG